MKLNPKADPKGDLDEDSNWDNFNVAPGKTHVLLDEQGPGRDHPYLDHLSRSRAAALGHRGLGQPPGNAPAHLLGRQKAALPSRPPWATSSPTASASAARSSAYRWPWPTATPTTASGACPFGSRPASRSSMKARNPSACCTTISTGSRRTRCPRTRPTSMPNTGRSTRCRRARITSSWKPRARGTTWARYWRSAPAARPGSAKATRKSTSTARAKPSVWGTGTEDYFLCAWGLRTDQHALFRRALFRSMGHRGRAYFGLPLAHP